ncbi:MAG: hypothetical protein CMJ18_08375 [Phycisphaeraceae bacterium]|nr:hypothetical protein [Phycisphaeraceae bacterium]
MNDAFLAGAAARSIMPGPGAIDNDHHPQMTVRQQEVGSPLQVKVLALTLAKRSFVLIVPDTNRIRESSADWMRDEIAGALGLDRTNMVVQCTHSHSTPFLETTDGPHPYLTQVTAAAVDAAQQAWAERRPARVGRGLRHVVGASFNQRVHLPDGGVKFTRDYREGLASGRPTDPRMTVLRFDDEHGDPIAGWIRFAAHPACVIFNAPISAEYPGYLTDRVRETVAGGAPVIFGFGAAGDVNCVPMFGTEDDTRRLGLGLADQAIEVFGSIETHAPRRLLTGRRTIDLPLDPVPDLETLDRDIAEVDAYQAGLDENPSAIWLLGSNAREAWSVEKKKAWAKPMGEWAERVKDAIAQGHQFPETWPVEVSACVLDDLGLIFYSGEVLTQIGLDIAARSPLDETLVMTHADGWSGYLGTDEDRQRGGYETANWHRMFKPMTSIRPLPYALGAAEAMIQGCLGLLNDLID